jgi:hypothetical protein
MKEMCQRFAHTSTHTHTRERARARARERERERERDPHFPDILCQNFFMAMNGLEKEKKVHRLVRVVGAVGRKTKTKKH